MLETGREKKNEIQTTLNTFFIYLISSETLVERFFPVKIASKLCVVYTITLGLFSNGFSWDLYGVGKFAVILSHFSFISSVFIKDSRLSF